MISLRTKFVTFKVEAGVNFSNQNSSNSRSSVKWHRNSQCESYKNLDIPQEVVLFSDFHKPLEKLQGFKAESFAQMESTHDGVFHGYFEEPYLPVEIVSLTINQYLYFIFQEAVVSIWHDQVNLLFCFVLLYNNVCSAYIVMILQI